MKQYPSGLEHRWRTLAVGLVAITLALRLLYCTQVELLPEEAYYWNYSRHLDFGYLDHPPMVAWLIRCGTALFGNTEFGVRFGALCCGAVASFFTFRLTRNLFGEASALLALILAQTLPFFFLSGVLMTPDAPLVAAWAASLHFLERAVVAGRKNAWAWAGLCMGLGFLSKYTIGLLALSTGVFVMLDPAARQWLRRWEPYASVALAALVASPVVIWNAQHEWASFAFQTSRRLAEQPRFSLHKLIASGLILISPTGLIAAIAAFIKGRSRSTTVAGSEPADRSWRFLRISLAVPLTVFVFFSLRHEVKLDWTGAPWLAALPALGFSIAEASRGIRSSHARAWLRAVWPVTIGSLLALYALGVCYLGPGLPGTGYSTQTELLPVGWRELGRQIDELTDGFKARNGDSVLVVGMDRYAIASELAFYSQDQVRAVAQTTAAHLFADRGLMYEQWFPPHAQAGRTLLLVAWTAEALAAQHLQARVRELDPIREGVLLQNGKTVRRYYWRIARGYRDDAKGA